MDDDFETFYGDPLEFTSRPLTSSKPASAETGAITLAPNAPEESKSMTTTTKGTRTLKHHPITSTTMDVEVPKGSQFLGTSRQGGKPGVLVSSPDGETKTTKRTLKSRTAGDSIEDGDKYIGSYRNDSANPDDALLALFGCLGDGDEDDDDM